MAHRVSVSPIRGQRMRIDDKRLFVLDHPIDAGADLRVLIVDDTRSVRRVVRAVLEAASGILVVGESANGQLGVADAKALKPDVVVMDGQMPVMDGPTATRLLRLQDPHTMVIAYTCSTLMGIEMMRAGALCIAAKNGNVSNLLEAVGEARRRSLGTRSAIAAATEISRAPMVETATLGP